MTPEAATPIILVWIGAIVSVIGGIFVPIYTLRRQIKQQEKEAEIEEREQARKDKAADQQRAKELNDLEDRLWARYQEERAQLIAAVKDLEAKLRAQNALIIDLQNENETLEAKVDHLQNENDRQRSRIRHLEELDEKRNGEIESLFLGVEKLLIQLHQNGLKPVWAPQRFQE